MKSKVEQTKGLDEEYRVGGAKAKVRERKLKQADTDIAFDKMMLYQKPKKIAEAQAVKEEPAKGAEFNPSAERYYQTTVPVRDRNNAREGTWSHDLASKGKDMLRKEKDSRKEREESKKEKMENGAMDDLKQIEEAHSEGGNRGKKFHKNKALEVFNTAEVKKKGNLSLQLPVREKQSEAGRSFQEQGSLQAPAAFMRIQAILEESDILKDLEELAEDGSDVVEGVGGGAQVDNTTTKKVNDLMMKQRGSENVPECLEVVDASVQKKQTGDDLGSPLRQKQTQKQVLEVKDTRKLEVEEQLKPISVPSSPEAEETLREGRGEVLTLNDSPQPNHPLRNSNEKCPAAEVVEIIEEDVEEEEAITGFLEKVPNVKANNSLSSIDSPIYPAPPPKVKNSPVKAIYQDSPIFKKRVPVKKLCVSSSSDEEEDPGIISCNTDTKDPARRRGGMMGPGLNELYFQNTFKTSV